MKKRVREAALLVAPTLGFFCLLLLAECGGRAWLKTVPDAARPSGLEHPPYFLVPNVTARGRFLFSPAGAKINSDGLRGPELAPEKGANKRVLVLGDSVVFGVTVKDDETLSVQLEKRLNEAAKGKRRWEVLNGGVSSYDVWDYEPFLRVKGLDFSPDIVVVGLYMNDHVPRLAAERSAAQRAGDAPAPRTLQSRARDAMDRSELLRGLRMLLERSGRNKFRLTGHRAPLTAEEQKHLESFFPGDAGTQAAVKGFLRDYRYPYRTVGSSLPALLDLPSWKKIEEPLAELKRLCAQKGLKLYVVVLPTQYQVYPGFAWPEPNATITGILKRQGIPHLDMQRLFSLTARGDELFNARNDIWHPGPEGYGLISEALYQRFKELGWL